jgi:CheY-like chemotaxis protein
MSILSWSGSATNFHILVVDDDAVEGGLLGDALRDLRPGTTVHTVSSSEQAIHFLYGDGEYADCPTPDLVFLDYRMPSNGGRVLSIIKGDPDLRMTAVVVLSAGASAEDIRDIYGRHANCCINKPIEASDLNLEVRAALAFWMDVAVQTRSHGRPIRRSASQS